MNRQELEAYIQETYAAQAEHLWVDDPLYAVFRHRENRKWFALVADISRSRLGLAGAGDISIVNLKCDPILVGSMVGQPGFFPAYHMSKTHWLTAALDGSADGEKLKFLLALSYDLTGPKSRGRKKAPGKDLQKS